MLVTCILAGFCLLLLFLNCYYKHVVLRNTQEYHIRKVAKGTWDALSFGSSYCRFGLDFSETTMKGYNLGFAGQFFYYTDRMLRQYARFAKRGGHIFIICADLCFAEVGKGWYNAHQYIKILDKEHLGDEFSYWKYVSRVMFPVIFHPRLIASVLKDMVFRIIGKSVHNVYSIDFNPMSEYEVALDAKKRCDGWCSQFGLKDTWTDDISETLEKKFEKTTKILENMIEFCLSQGLSPVLVCTPLSRHLNRLLSDDFLERVLFSNIRKANRANVPFLDYTRDARFQDSGFYIDADKLNAMGRKYFTKVLVNDISKIEQASY